MAHYRFDILCSRCLYNRWYVSIVRSQRLAHSILPTSNSQTLFVGYGDLSPSSDLSRIFTVCFALYGIVILGIFLGVLGDFILDQHEENMKARIENVRVKVMEQFGAENSSKPPEVRTVYKDAFDVVVAMTPLILVVVALGCPIGILEGWDGFMK